MTSKIPQILLLKEIDSLEVKKRLLEDFIH